MKTLDCSSKISLKVKTVTERIKIKVIHRMIKEVTQKIRKTKGSRFKRIIKCSVKTANYSNPCSNQQTKQRTLKNEKNTKKIL